MGSKIRNEFDWFFGDERYEGFMAIACVLFFSCYLVVFLLENGMARNLYKRIHGEMDGYHLKKVLRMIGKGGLDDELAGMARKIMILHRLSLIFLLLLVVCFFYLNK